jgi:hypothetical protein
MSLYRALVKTHHMTSRRKIAALTQAASRYDCAVLIRTGGVPGIMFVKGKTEDDVQAWVARVRVRSNPTILRCLSLICWPKFSILGLKAYDSDVGDLRIYDIRTIG